MFVEQRTLTADEQRDPGEPALVPGALRLRVDEIIWETEDARSISLLAEGAEPVGYRSGQFITFRVPVGGTPVARSYSLSSAPGTEPGRLVVTVKRQRGGLASTWLCEQLRVGDRLLALPPAGNFFPRDLNRDVLLIARSSGITPMLSILKTLLGEGTGRCELFYANRDNESTIFRRQLTELEQQYPGRVRATFWDESASGRTEAELLSEHLAAFRGWEAFVCGSTAFETTALDALQRLGFPHGDVHVEDFVSLTGDPFLAVEAPTKTTDADTDTVSLAVELNGETHELRWPRAQRLLDTLLAAGIAAPFSCREGACSACACVLNEGEMSMDNNEVLDETDLAEGLRLSCQSRPMSDDIRVSYDG